MVHLQTVARTGATHTRKSPVMPGILVAGTSLDMLAFCERLMSDPSLQYLYVPDLATANDFLRGTHEMSCAFSVVVLDGVHERADALRRFLLQHGGDDDETQLVMVGGTLPIERVPERIRDGWRTRYLWVPEHSAPDMLRQSVEIMSAGWSTGRQRRTQADMLRSLVSRYSEALNQSLLSSRIEQDYNHVSLKNQVLLDTVNEAILTVSGDGRILSANVAAEKLFGCKSSDLLRRMITRILPGMGRMDNFINHAGYEMDAVTQDQRHVRVRVKTSIMCFQQERAFVCCVEDINELDLERKKLQESSDYMEAVLNNLPDMLVVRNRHHELVSVNDAACDIMGNDRQSLLQGDACSRMSAMDIEREHRLDEEVLAKGVPVVVEQRYQDAEGRERTVVIKKCRYLSATGEVHVISAGRDISERVAAEERLTHQANHDALTGLLNRRAFEQLVENELRQLRVHKNEHCLMYIDLDQFKIINDTCGHAAGDQLLKQLPEVMGRYLRDQDKLARLGGDEFGLLLRNISCEQAEQVAWRMLQAIQQYRFYWADKVFTVGASIGLVVMKNADDTLAGLLSSADHACYLAKDMGRNRIQVYRFDDHELTARRAAMDWVSRINNALAQNRFCIFRQAIMPLHEKSGPSHYEILLRMLDDEGGYIPPASFIPSAERYNLMPQLDRWCIQHSLEQLADSGQKDLSIALNLSGTSLSDDEMTEFVRRMLRRTGVSPENICFEITETAAIACLRQAGHFIRSMREMGARIALDDFGSGLSSFSYLKNMEIDVLKIDGAFVRDIVDDKVDHAMVCSMQNIARLMGISTVAEFVETEAQRAVLTSIGIDYGQGYGLHRPERWVV